MFSFVKVMLLSVAVVCTASQAMAQAIKDTTATTVTAASANNAASSNNQGRTDTPPKGIDPVGGPLPKKVVDQLGLTPEQKSQLDGALNARKDLQAANRSTRDAAYKSLTDQLASDKFDPRVVIQQRQQARIAMDARSDAVQQKWLMFWDGLSQTQRNTLIQYMREQHAAHAKNRAK